MSLPFRFSPRPNQAARIGWREWGPDAFAEAVRTDRPVFLVVTTVWSGACQTIDETTLSEDEVIAILNGAFVPVRVDGDRMPHVQDRYVTGGWPTMSFLTPTGEVIWSATAADAPMVMGAAHGVIAAWSERRAEFEAEIARRRRAYQSAERRTPAAGLVRRAAAESVINALRATFDARNGGFGGPPKFPPVDALELLISLGAAGDVEAAAMAVQTLDGIRAGELFDEIDGGFYRYALAPDWTEPRREKLLDVNAGLLRAFAAGAALHSNGAWREVCDATVAWAERTLALHDGLWGGSQLADARYFATGADGRGTLSSPPCDPTVYTDRTASWIAALADAGRVLANDDWVQRAHSALPTLIATAMPGDKVFHWRENNHAHVPGLLVDPVALLRACIAVHAATRDRTILDQAKYIQRVLEKSFWADSGGFWDHVTPAPVGAVRDRQKPFVVNVEAVRALLALASATGERGPRAMAESTLAILSAGASRYGVEAAGFVLAVNAFFNPAVSGV